MFFKLVNLLRSKTNFIINIKEKNIRGKSNVEQKENV